MPEERRWFTLARAECFGSVPQRAAVSHSLLFVEILTQSYRSLWPLFLLVNGQLAGFLFFFFLYSLCFLTPAAQTDCHNQEKL